MSEMSRREVLGYVAALLIGVGVLLGAVVGVSHDVGSRSISCGTAWSPDRSEAQSKDSGKEAANSLINDTSEVTDAQEGCSDAISTRRTITYGLLGLGGVAALMAIAGIGAKPEAAS